LTLEEYLFIEQTRDEYEESRGDAAAFAMKKGELIITSMNDVIIYITVSGMTLTSDQEIVDMWRQWFNNNLRSLRTANATKYAELLVNNNITTTERLETAVKDNCGFMTEMGVDVSDAKDIQRALNNTTKSLEANVLRHSSIVSEGFEWREEYTNDTVLAASKFPYIKSGVWLLWLLCITLVLVVVSAMTFRSVGT
jgi:hypothetical protein